MCGRWPVRRAAATGRLCTSILDAHRDRASLSSGHIVVNPGHDSRRCRRRSRALSRRCRDLGGTSSCGLGWVRMVTMCLPGVFPNFEVSLLLAGFSTGSPRPSIPAPKLPCVSSPPRTTSSPRRIPEERHRVPRHHRRRRSHALKTTSVFANWEHHRSYSMFWTSTLVGRSRRPAGASPTDSVFDPADTVELRGSTSRYRTGLRHSPMERIRPAGSLLSVHSRIGC
ncbi:hypothetical protein SAMN04489740_1107 [Arthrobacter alpinus]|uniref:Uncharacterized protein n=1 Tax=Arthrobacter alpinus TaxID=656366 RepID=A0A1H5HTX5_9MICC|nr:hypothetical protein SAMN04489740_1107 [Arthrobacter alpinus]